MIRCRWSSFCAAVFVLGSLHVSLPAQAPVNDVNYSRFAVFRIPFNADANDRRIRQVQLHASTDQGQSWYQVGAVAPDLRYFDYQAPRDGLYWFATRTVDTEGRAYPQSLQGASPALRVIVDTQPPVIRLRALPARDGEAGVEWEVRDENLDPASLRLDYRAAGGVDWVPVAADMPVTGQRFFRPAGNGAAEVRLRARDRADNWGEERVSASPAGYPEPGASSNRERPSVLPTDTPIRLVNSTHFALNYDIKDRGPSGIDKVELWYTEDPYARKWQKWREDPGNTQSPFQVAVTGEGLYGFTLLAHSGAGLHEQPPQPGDRPQVWVEVDTTKPLVRINAVEVGQGSDAGRLTVNWTASDKNLGRQPITISYAEQATGPWKPIASSLENTGRYVWAIPKETPFLFHVRVEAADRAGNVGSAQTEKPVNTDLARPKSVILGVTPGEGSGNQASEPRN